MLGNRDPRTTRDDRVLRSSSNLIFYKETHQERLRDLFSKTAGIVPALQSELARFRDKIHGSAIYGSITRSEEGAESDMDLLVGGDAATADLLPAGRRVGRQFGREVNIKLYSQREFRNKMRNGD